MVAQAVAPDIAQGAFTLAPRGAARDLLNRRDGEIVISGPVFTGKTYPALWKVHLAATKYSGMRGLFCRKENSALAGSSLVTYRRHVLAAVPDYAAHVKPFGGSKLEPPGYRYPNGSFIAVGGIDDDRIMGSEYDIILVDEAREVARGDWESLITRRRWGVMPYQQMIGATNPDSPSHWMWQRYVDGSLPILFSEHRDNPKMHDGRTWTEFGQVYLDDISRTLSGHRRARLLEGKWVGAEGVVYPGFNRQTCVRKVDCEGWRTLLGVDVGTRNPTAILRIRAASDDRRHVERELYRGGMSSDEITDAIAAEIDATGADAAYLDPSAKSYIESLRRRGYKQVHAANNEVAFGIGVVTTAIDDGLTIDPSCVNTIREAETYRYPENRTNDDKPVKEDDHAMDGLRYGLVGAERSPRRKTLRGMN